MAYTLSTATTEVRKLINEDTAAFWSDGNIQEWIKQGCLDWSEKSLLHTKRDTITLVNGQTIYTTSTNSDIDDAIRVVHAEYNGIALQRIAYETIKGHNARKLATTKTPAYYFDIYNETTFTVHIGPTPSATEAGNDITVYFAKRTDDITLIPYEYQPTIFLYAASKCKYRERQYQEAALYYQNYVNNIAFARTDSLQRGIQPTGSFRIQ
jgi:hypothetical protein